MKYSSCFLTLFLLTAAVSTFSPPYYQLGTGPGGNRKTGRVMYDGQDRQKLWVKKVNGKCRLESPDVVIIDARHPGEGGFEFDCYNQASDEVNGGYSPMNDAMYFATKTIEMLRQYYSIPLPLPIRITTHSGEKAYTKGVMWLGDGDDKTYPWTTMNIVSHEIGHLITEHTSKLEYIDNPGGMDEAFCDMTAKTLEKYLTGRFDWQIGAGVTKSPGISVRCMDHPTCSNALYANNFLGIGHYRDYHNGMAAHVSSGIYGKAFYNLVQAPGYDIYKAYALFFYANTNKWRSSNQFDTAAKFLLRGLNEINNREVHYDYPGSNNQLDESEVMRAFRDVGVLCYKYYHTSQGRNKYRCGTCDEGRYIIGVPEAEHLVDYLC